jgi:glycosyltransferase involved in cell wall biosynthesis
MIDRLREINSYANSNAMPLLVGGLAFVVTYNWRLWLHDKALVERLRAEHAPVPQLAHTPKVSALVAAWNEAGNIAAHIDSFLALDLAHTELVLCTGGADGTLDIARRYASARLTVLEQQPGEGKQCALARCLEHATGEIIYLTDADCLFDDEALVRLLAPIVNDGEQATTGGSRPMDWQLAMFLPTYIWSAETVSQFRSPSYVEGLLGRNAAVTRSALLQSGGLAFAAPTGTDYHLARRLIASDVRIRHVAASIVQSVYPETVSAYWRKQSRWMRNLLVYGGQYAAYRQVGDTLRSAIVGAAMLGMPALALLGARWSMVAWCALMLHALLSKIRYADFNAGVYGWRRTKRFSLLLLPITLAEFVIWITPLWQVLRLKNRERW